ncbi:MAG TPA: DUF6519 domain-containing protein, partial [Candidatus Binatus sp.]|nr:DUF6519 domain-containing protein [Candidatus Binatus sp.]
PKVRRWDQIETDAVTLVDGAMPIQESPAGSDVWIDLEDGVQIQFSAGGEYRAGDYWLIPARVATGSVEWPQDDELNPQPLPPRGIEHHYALLGFASWANQKLNVENARFEFWPLLSGVAQSSLQPGPIHVVGPGAKPDATEAAPAKAPKARRRPTKRGPSSPAEGAPS